MPALRVAVDPTGQGRLFAHGILVPGLKAVIAHAGADVLLVVDADAIALEDVRPVAIAQDVVAGGPLATDGNA